MDSGKTIKTKSFELAILARGDKSSEKLAILIPGRLDTKDYANFVGHAEYLAGRGFYSVAFDPPGSWESPGGMDLYTTTNYLKAVDELVEYFGNKPTLLLGHSRGGTAAILESGNPSVIGIILVMPNYGMPSPSSEALKTGFHPSHRDMPPGISPTKEQKEFMLPISYWDDARQYDPMRALTECKKPKLLVYGTQDTFTSPEAEKRIFAAIPEPKMIHEVDSEHDYRYHPDAIEEVNKAIGLFLSKSSI